MRDVDEGGGPCSTVPTTHSQRTRGTRNAIGVAAVSDASESRRSLSAQASVNARGGDSTMSVVIDDATRDAQQ